MNYSRKSSAFAPRRITACKQGAAALRLRPRRRPAAEERIQRVGESGAIGKHFDRRACAGNTCRAGVLKLSKGTAIAGSRRCAGEKRAPREPDAAFFAPAIEADSPDGGTNRFGDIGAKHSLLRASTVSTVSPGRAVERRTE